MDCVNESYGIKKVNVNWIRGIDLNEAPDDLWQYHRSYPDLKALNSSCHSTDTANELKYKQVHMSGNMHDSRTLFPSQYFIIKLVVIH